MLNKFSIIIKYVVLRWFQTKHMFCVKPRWAAPNIIIEDCYVHEFAEFRLDCNVRHTGLGRTIIWLQHKLWNATFAHLYVRILLTNYLDIFTALIRRLSYPNFYFLPSHFCLVYLEFIFRMSKWKAYYKIIRLFQRSNISRPTVSRPCVVSVAGTALSRKLTEQIADRPMVGWDNWQLSPHVTLCWWHDADRVGSYN